VPDQPPDFGTLLDALSCCQVRFVVIGGLAMRCHGSAHLTEDVDIVFARSPDNLEALVQALMPLHPQLRTINGPVPFLWDSRTLRAGANFTLITDAGDIDVLSEVAGVSSFEELWDRSVEIDLFDLTIRVASIDDLISMKRAAGRGKDQAHLLELESLRRLLAEKDVPATGPDSVDERGA